MKIEPKSIQSLEKSPEKSYDPKLKEVAKGFETIFVNQMITAMRKTIQKGGLVPESNAQRVYESMLDAEYAQKMTDAEVLGLSDLVYEHLLRQSNAR